MSTRQEKLEALLKQEISEILRKEFGDPRIGFVTITDAEVSSDVSHAKVFVSILGSEEQKKESLKVLKHAQSYVRQLLSKRVKLRTVPTIDFRIDESIDEGMKITELLEQVKNEQQD